MAQSSPSDPSPAPPRRPGVLGIGLITEELGKGARVAFRYPASPPPCFLDASASSGGGGGGRHPGEAQGGAGGHRGRAGRPPGGGGTSKSNGNDKGADPGSDGGNNGDDDPHDGGSADLFFDLPARVLSKLFRPKRPLCGQPLTLNVSGTTFCCRAELFDAQNPAPATVGGGGGGEAGASTNGGGGGNPLVLFSVIVALAPVASSAGGGDVETAQSSHCYSTQHSFDTFGNEKHGSDHSSSHNNHHHHHHLHPHMSQRTDEAFATVRRVHANLARLCRVLMREEIRCQYVSRQCGMLLQVQREYESRAGPECTGTSTSGESSSGGGGGGTKAVTAAGDGTVAGKKGDAGSAPPGPPPLSPKVSKTTVVPPAAAKGKDAKSSKPTAGSSNEGKERPAMTRSQRRAYVQNLIEFMLAASPPAGANATRDEDSDGRDVYGNLARELAQAFHCMSSSSSSSSTNALRGLVAGATGEGVVYVNRHIAVPLDPVDASTSMHLGSPSRPNDGQGRAAVQPHDALLFPRSSPAEVLSGLAESGGVGETNATAPSIVQSLQRIVPHILPRKTLSEIAWESGIPLPHVMDVAAWLVGSKTCVAAPPVLRKNRYVCTNGVVAKMSALALPFWQAFGARSRRCKFYWGSGAAGPEDDDDDSTGRRRTGTVGAPHIFVVVSALTTKADGNGTSVSSAPPTLGEAIDSLCSSDDPASSDTISSLFPRGEGFRYGEHRRPASANNLNRDINPGAGVMDLSSAEEIAYSMACWLVANGIILEASDAAGAANDGPSRRGRNGNRRGRTPTLEDV